MGLIDVKVKSPQDTGIQCDSEDGVTTTDWHLADGTVQTNAES